MGNQLPVPDPVQEIEKLNISSEEKKNFNLYLWRASSQVNQHIPKVTLNFPQLLNKRTDPFSCLSLENNFAPNISFQNYVCDFRTLKGFLNLSELLTVFRSVLNGHQTIFAKLNATLISDKCCFLTHDGEVRVWINPNYYLNELWIVQKQEFRIRSCSARQMNCQTPRFMNKEEFQFQTVTLLTSESTIVRKIMQWMNKFSNKSSQSCKFWIQLQKFVEDNILSNCCFSRIQRFINTFAYQNKVSLKSNIDDAVKRLIKQSIILRSDHQNIDIESKKKISMIQSTYTKKAPSKINITIDGDSNGISVLDIKNTQSNHLYSGNQNFSRLLRTTLNEQDGFKPCQKKNQKQESEGPINTKTSIKQKKFGHKRKLSKSLVHPNLQKMVESTTLKQYDFPSARSSTLQNVDEWSTRIKSKSFYGEKTSRHLNFSYQYSINLHTSQTHRITQKSQDQTQSRPHTIFNSFQDNNFCTTDKLKASNNSRTGSILKKGHTKSFQVSKQKDNIEYENEFTSRKKHPVILEPEKTYELEEEEYENQVNTQLRFSTFRVYSGYDFTPQSAQIFKKFQKQQNIQDCVKGSQRMQSTKRTATRTRKNSQVNYFDFQQTEKGKFRPFNEITNQQLDSQKKPQPFTYEVSKTNIHPDIKCDDRRYRGQTSLLLNAKYADDGIQQEIIRSKMRISAGPDNNFEKKFKVLANQYTSGISTLNHPNKKTPRTITRLFSSENKLQTSFGSMSSNSNQFSQDQNHSKYTGILTKMGRSVPFRKVPDGTDKLLELERVQSKKFGDEMPNFTRKKTIYEHGSNRSMKV